MQAVRKECTPEHPIGALMVFGRLVRRILQLRAPENVRPHEYRRAASGDLLSYILPAATQLTCHIDASFAEQNKICQNFFAAPTSLPFIHQELMEILYHALGDRTRLLRALGTRARYRRSEIPVSVPRAGKAGDRKRCRSGCGLHSNESAAHTIRRPMVRGRY